MCCHRKVVNAIWDLSDGTGSRLVTQKDLEYLAKSHFSGFFNAGNTDVSAHLEVASHLPTFFTLEEGRSLYHAITLEEIKNVIDHFARDKSPNPDGWKVEFLFKIP